MTDILDIKEETNAIKSSRSEILISPTDLLNQYPCLPNVEQFIAQKRKEISDIVNGTSDRLLVVIGPCSIHNIDEGMEYAKRLSIAAKNYESTLMIVMRVYLEKPRTIVGWKGLIYDPHLDGTNDINSGLEISRKLLLAVNSLGLSCATELLQPMLIHYVADLISWAAIGARTTESQIHRELVSGLNMPVGFKNGTTGCVKMAVNACLSSQMSHASFSINNSGNIVAYHTPGNNDVHVVLRGGTLTGPNYSAEHMLRTQQLLNESKLKCKIMVDCSHGNCMQDGERQKAVINDVCEQVACGDVSIMGVMVESNLVDGRQVFVEGKKHLLDYGKSITDACIGWDATVLQLKNLSDAVVKRRKFNYELQPYKTEHQR
jgi:3-deoxy-7-phosphoheptulonate synthase